ncbi:unnamed protein product [Symbiodinium pilosum]|uniref:SAM domain-containing protein n=1 Tax=Symbiodinium pilosum TaxID=2952 RepID=A0A812L562_SYMPI|nr:unnamed protein product [Symbiodinium pilosum]
MQKALEDAQKLEPLELEPEPVEPTMKPPPPAPASSRWSRRSRESLISGVPTPSTARGFSPESSDAELVQDAPTPQSTVGDDTGDTGEAPEKLPPEAWENQDCVDWLRSLPYVWLELHVAKFEFHKIDGSVLPELTLEELEEEIEISELEHRQVLLQEIHNLFKTSRPGVAASSAVQTSDTFPPASQ